MRKIYNIHHILLYDNLISNYANDFSSTNLNCIFRACMLKIAILVNKRNLITFSSRLFPLPLLSRLCSRSALALVQYNSSDNVKYTRCSCTTNFTMMSHSNYVSVMANMNSIWCTLCTLINREIN